MTLEITGNEGVEVLTFTSGTTASAIAFAVNRISDATGVQAELINSATPTSGITFKSTGYGTQQLRLRHGAERHVRHRRRRPAPSRPRDVGGDAVATVNGALTVGDGLNIKLNTTTLDLELTLDETFGIGADQLRHHRRRGAVPARAAGHEQPAGERRHPVGRRQQAGRRRRRVPQRPGHRRHAARSSAARPAQASQIIERAIRQVAVLRGRLGAFEKNTLETNINSLSVALENVTASESTIRDADFAEETAALTRAQILTQAGTSVLATANTTPQSVLSLLG